LDPLNFIRKLTKRERGGPELIAQPTFSQSDVRYRCTCCSPAKRVIITVDGSGYEQYTCPETRITMRLAPCKAMPYTNPRTGRTEYKDASTYMAGHLIIR
jgi:hypothetical protein